MDIMELLRKANLPETQGAGYYDKLSANPLFNVGIGLLSNNSGNYGEFAPALGRGVAQGMQSTDVYRQRLKKDLEQEKYRKMLQESLGKGWKQDVTPGLLSEKKGFQQSGNFTQDEDTAQMMAMQAGNINEMLAMPPSNGPQPAQTFGLGDRPLPMVGTPMGGPGQIAEPLPFEQVLMQTANMNPDDANQILMRGGFARPTDEAAKMGVRGSYEMPK